MTPPKGRSARREPPAPKAATRRSVPAGSATRKRKGADRQPGSERPRAEADHSLRDRLALEPASLRWTIQKGSLGFESTAELEPLMDLHAQPRAIEAMRVGTEVPAAGYNVFCVGLTGPARMTVLKDALTQIGPPWRPALDRCYVRNFRAAECPRLLELPRGTARRFSRDVDELIDVLIKHLGLVFEEDRFAGRVREIREKHERQERELLNHLHDLAREQGFSVSQVETEEGTTVDLLYRLPNAQLTMADLERALRDVAAGAVPEITESEEENQALVEPLSAVDFTRARAAYETLSEMLRKSMIEARHIGRTMQQKLSALEREECLVVVEGAVRELAARHPGVAGIRAHLDELRADVLDHLALFKRGSRAEPDSDADEDSDARRDTYNRYRVNVVLDNGGQEECPVLVESNPSARNIFGTILSQSDRNGRPIVDHRSIRAGSLLQADGGFLLLDANEVLAEPETWRSLKRVLLERQLDLRDAVSERGMPAGLVLHPDPIPVTVKVLMVGDHDVYDFLDSMDGDFKHVFRIRAEFDALMDRSHENVRRIGSFVRRLSIAEDLSAFTAEAVAELAEHAARLAEQPGRMVSRFELLAEPVRQSNLRAAREGAEVVAGRHVREALAAAARRCSLTAERVHHAIQEKRIIINTTGTRVGQVNGLAVVSTIEHSFGYPVRISAVVAHGNSGVLNIEREVRLSGSLHDKGMFIVQGYLSYMYGDEFPLAFSASVAFEQLYGGIEGDSASSAEIYALLSALSRVPLDQGIGVTGSVNQVGEIQPVGGVNEKIEGFFEACSGIAGGWESMPGGQGVIIPSANVGDLMLRDDVVRACEAGLFHVFAIDSIDDGLELLMGVPAGNRHDRRYAAGSVHAKVRARLRALSASSEQVAPGAGSSAVRYREKPAPSVRKKAEPDGDGS